MCFLVDEGEDDWNIVKILELSSKNSEFEL